MILSSRSTRHSLWAIALGLCACGEGPREQALGPLALSLVARSAPLAEPRLVASFQASPELLEAWRFFDADASYVEGVHGGSLLVRPSGASPAFEISTVIDPDTVNQIVVHLENNGRTDLHVQLQKEGQFQLLTKTIQQPTKRAPTPVVLDLTHAALVDGLLIEGSDSVRIFCKSRGKAVNIYGVDFLWVPPESTLPLPSRDPSTGGPIGLGGEFRMALCLKEGQAVKGRVAVPQECELRFAFGIPRQALFTGGGGVLSVTARVEGKQPVVESYAIEGGRFGEWKWKERSLDLAVFAGAEVRLSFEYLGLGVEGGLLALAIPRLVQPAPSPKHVVLITSDTHRGDHLGVARDGVLIRTPFLDGIAEQGVYFEDCFSTSNITVPSHAAIMTGLSPKEAGIIDNITALSDDANTLAEAFRGAGYYTAAVLSTAHLSHDNSGLGQGFDRMLTTKRSKQVGQLSIAGVEEIFRAEGDQPVFLWLHLFDAHAPYQPPDEYRHEYYSPDLDPYTQGTGITDGNRAIWDKRIKDLEFILSQYKSEITYLDALLAEVFDTPRFADSILAFTADHGESLGGHGIYFKHRGIYWDTINVPLLLRWPGCPVGVRSPAPVQNSDLGRTLLDLAGLEAVDFAGESLLGRLGGDAQSAPRFVIGSHGHHASVEQGGWLCVMTIQATIDFPDAVPHQVELYNLERDPACEHDLIEVEFERAKAMRRGLVEWLSVGRRAGLALVRDQRSAELLETIAALGYTTGVGVQQGPYYSEDPESEWCLRFR